MLKRFHWETRWIAFVIFSSMAMALPALPANAVESVKQNVFLICPSTARNSALSLYVLVDARDHRNVLALGIEELIGINSSGSSYNHVLDIQRDPKTRRKPLGTLEAKDFGSRELIVEKDDSLHVSLTPRRDGTYEVMCNVRVGATERFVIGGTERAKRAAMLKYDESEGTWHAVVEALSDSKGAKIEGAIGRTITGVLFPVTGTGIYMVAVAFDDGTGVLMLDR